MNKAMISYNSSSVQVLTKICIIFLMFVASITRVVPRSIVRNLPGYPGPLPFKLETGYIGVGKDERVQLFYLFVESEGNPAEDPLLIAVSGGPGCTILTALFFQIGPFQLRYENSLDNVTELELDPYSWTKVASIVYLDAPTLTGFSYTTVPKANRSSDTLSSTQTTEFIRKFVKGHSKFSKNPMYVVGWSYAGIVVPMITEELYKGNEQGLEPIINIKGYMLANPLTDKRGDINSRLEFSYNVGLISKELFESTRRNCKGEYADADSNNLLCISNIDEVNERVRDINIQHTLDRNCYQTTNFVKVVNPIRKSRCGKTTNPIKMVTTQSPVNEIDSSCLEDVLAYAIDWANDKSVMKALKIRKGTVDVLLRCNPGMRFRYGETSMPLYEFNVPSSVPYHKKLKKRNSRALIYSGDHDLLCPHFGTLDWINSLNMTVTNSNWDAWYFDGQIAGYKTTYAYNDLSLTFTTIKGAGHIPQLYKREECFEMAKRWFVDTPI